MLVFKILVIQAQNDLSDERAEFLISDRLSFMRFLGLGLHDRVPDAKTIWSFRDWLTHAGAIETPFERFDTATEITGIGAAEASYTRSMEYDALGRLFRSIGAEGQIWTAAYDVEDNLTTLTDPETYSVLRDFDALNRTASIRDQAGHVTELDHDTQDRMTVFEDARDLGTGFAYNGFGDVWRVRRVIGGQIFINRPTFDEAGNLTRGRVRLSAKSPFKQNFGQAAVCLKRGGFNELVQSIGGSAAHDCRLSEFSARDRHFRFLQRGCALSSS